MEREVFLTTERTAFSVWRESDLPLANALWGDPLVTCYISASGVFTPEQIVRRLQQERENYEKFGLQYWPFFTRDGDFIGCCGLRPHETGVYELGFHLRPEYWGQGYAVEAAEAVVVHAFETLAAQKLFAGHNPQNTRSQKVLKKLGFSYLRDEFYEPTGLYHPSYELTPQQFKGRRL